MVLHPSGTASVVDPESSWKQQISVEIQKFGEWTEETNYHLRLSALAPRLFEFYRADRDWIVPRALYKEVIAVLENGLEDLSISRPRSCSHWGIPAPTDPAPMTYVWLDTKTNYLINPTYPTCSDGMRFYLLQEGGITDDGDKVRTIADRHKKGCVVGLGNLAGRIRRQKFDLEKAVKRSVEIDLSELPPEDQGHHDLLQKTPLLAAGKMEGLHLNPPLKDIMNAV
ncbi:hypothetical protein L873DRAFT_1810721 [Choiromyces venosus 120613-1]|uniref:Methionyl/Leucyl tRNA synthetase domain-containing protein n=1 Tax=Choiromyces venosus 120613-1 TaxID=1336337 RepID=A0A3N4JF90_9PEZI|nr:hypothetical protein L873DRAFT_1810721 [Choiromyces venosus 120613-1]